MTPRTETVTVSHYLCDTPPVITGAVAESLVRSLRLVDPDYQDTVGAGYVETLEEFAIRISRGGA
ncbi:hypothetical protein EES43_24220 [Streptomyces sp. ADI96-02]|uniref:hypothetical protein n=1 Tax=Streptomyces sp. ADI96-02 TaxID=1522760 RepID=UPI000F54E8A4|nr:hypothetical protein [Streptomyces sp. ADI96-02]RPK56150.1 hypothetical protein EES43_24220 [Streptomyces sp. ADI96-02]